MMLVNDMASKGRGFNILKVQFGGVVFSHVRLLQALYRSILTFTVVFGEIANFAAYAFAPAILVTPLGALSVLIGCDPHESTRQNVLS